MTQQDAANVISAAVTGAEANLTALQSALQVLQDGYASDQDRIDAGVAAGITSGVASAIASAIGPLNTQITDLEAAGATKDTMISEAIACLQDADAADDAARVANALQTLQISE